MEAIQEFTASEKTINRTFYMGIFMIVAGIALFFLTGFSILVGLGILYIIMGAISKNRKIIILYPDHLEIKLAPLASKKLLKYDQITNFYTSKRNLELQYDPKKKIKIPVELLEKDNLHEFDRILQEKTSLADSNSLISNN